MKESIFNFNFQIKIIPGLKILYALKSFSLLQEMEYYVVRSNSFLCGLCGVLNNNLFFMLIFFFFCLNYNTKSATY